MSGIYDKRTTTIIVGGGQAGSETAFALRSAGYDGRIALVGEEPALPYKRPPLSKAFLVDDASIEMLSIRPAVAYESAEIEVISGVRVVNVDPEKRRIELNGGDEREYDFLVLATGGVVRRLSVPGADALNVCYLRTAQDALAIRSRLTAGSRLVVIGGGYIGLEIAAHATQKGVAVSVVEAAPRVLARVTAKPISDFYEDVHRANGVDLRTGKAVQAIDTIDGLAVAVVLDDGSRIPAELVVVGVGITPAVSLAADAGLAIENGIITDLHCRTSDSAIFAVGDCANAMNGFLGLRMRVESVPNALEQARIAASVIAGASPPPQQPPWFWSDQYDLKLQMVGLTQGYDDVVLRGDPANRSFLLFYLRQSTIIAVDSVNRAREFAIAKRLVAERCTPNRSSLSDEAVAL